MAERRGFDTSTTALLCFSGAGFTADLQRRAAGSASGTAVQLVDPDRLYHGARSGEAQLIGSTRAILMDVLPLPAAG